MGEPNSDMVDMFEKLCNTLVLGEKPYLTKVQNMLLYKRFLERTFEMVKPQLPYIPGYKPLAELPAQSIENKHEWRLLANSATFAERKCVRLVTEHYSDKIRGYVYKPILKLFTPAHSDRNLEVYLTRDGHWIVYHQGVISGEQPYERLTEHYSTDQLCEHLEEIQENSGYRIIIDAYPIPIARTLIYFVEKSIKEREERLARQKSLVERWNEMRVRLCIASY
jgi:hypothetical protein